MRHLTTEMIIMAQKDNLEKNILDWLNSEGFPLEYRCANVFRKWKFETFQGRYVNDYKTNTPKEIDVIAQRTFDVNDSFLRIMYLTECKWSADKPWVIFTDTNSKISPSACITQSISSNIVDSILWLLANDKEIQKLSMFETPDRPGFNGKQVFSKQNDLVYSTLQSTISACYSEKKFYEKYVKKQQDIYSHGTLIFPIIVIEGKLFETYFDAQKEEMVIKEQKKMRLHWKGSEARNLHSTIDIVTIEELDNYVSNLDKETNILIKKMTETFFLINKCIENKSVDPIKHMIQGEKGILSLPPILDKLLTE